MNVKTFLFPKIQFSLSTQFSSVWPIDKALLGATTPGQSGPGSDGNKGVLRIPQSSRFTEASPSDYLLSYQDNRWGSLLVYSAVSADCACVCVRVCVCVCVRVCVRVKCLRTLMRSQIKKINQEDQILKFEYLTQLA